MEDQTRLQAIEAALVHTAYLSNAIANTHLAESHQIGIVIQEIEAVLADTRQLWNDARTEEGINVPHETNDPQTQMLLDQVELEQAKQNMRDKVGEMARRDIPDGSAITNANDEGLKEQD